ncbi:MAG: hypothetical protein AAB658_13665, partial [Chloroflexota bacterium]
VAADDPVLFNNIFWDNRAGEWDGVTVGGIGLANELPGPTINLWDLGEVGGGSGPLTPTNSILNEDANSNIAPDASNQIGVDPLVIDEYDTSVAVFPWRTNPNFVQAAIVALDLPINLLGNYHLTAGSPAINAGSNSKAASLPPSPVNAPDIDIDNELRAIQDIGADEIPDANILFFSTSSSTTPPGLTAGDDADVYGVNGPTAGADFSRLLDATAAGVVLGADVDALAMSGGDIYVSFKDTHTITGVGSVQDEDVVRCVPTTVSPAGVVTGCTWSLYFDGTAAGVGLAGATEDVDAFEILPDGSLLISTDGNPVVSGLPGGFTARDEDLLLCAPTFTSGVVTSCAWSVYFDASDVGLGLDTSDGLNAEDVDGVAV